MPVTGNTTPELKNAIEYNILCQENDVKMSYSNAASGTTIYCEVAWEDIEYFRRDMLGYAEFSGGTLVRVLPERCEFPGCEEQYCMGMELVKAITFSPAATALSPGNWPVYERAVFACQFAAPPYDVLEDSETPEGDESVRNVVWTKRMIAANEKIPGGGFKFIDSNKTPLAEVGVKTGRVVNLQAKWIDVPELPIISSFANKINEFALVWNHEIYDAETVLVETMAYDYRKNPFGDWTFDVTYNLAIRQDGRTWNKFWKNGDEGYVEVSSDGTTGGDRPFEVADLADLFNLGL
jgi:hypothetical protein